MQGNVQSKKHYAKAQYLVDRRIDQYKRKPSGSAFASLQPSEGFRTLPVPLTAGVWHRLRNGTEWMRDSGIRAPAWRLLWKGSRRRGTSRPWRWSNRHSHPLNCCKRIGGLWDNPPAWTLQIAASIFEEGREKNSTHDQHNEVLRRWWYSCLKTCWTLPNYLNN